MCISLIPSITTPINSLTKYFLILKDIIPRFGRVFNAFKIPLEQERIQSSLKLMDIQSHLRIIEIKNVTLFFNKIKILDDISLTINRGDHVLIKGESGSGKTTIINVLLKEVIPNSGEVMLHGKNYNDLLNLEIRSKIGICHQELFFFNGTIKENLLLGNTIVTNQEINEALYLSCMDEFVLNHERGLEMILYDNANNLSGGQRQRLAIARAILSKKEILLLDETSSGLDGTLEIEMFRRLKSKPNLTLLVVSHNKSISHLFTKIYYLKNSTISPVDNREESFNV